MSAAEVAPFRSCPRRTERSSASGTVVSTSGEAARSTARDGRAARIPPEATLAAVSTDGEREARTPAPDGGGGGGGGSGSARGPRRPRPFPGGPTRAPRGDASGRSPVGHRPRPGRPPGGEGGLTPAVPREQVRRGSAAVDARP